MARLILASSLVCLVLASACDEGTSSAVEPDGGGAGAPEQPLDLGSTSPNETSDSPSQAPAVPPLPSTPSVPQPEQPGTGGSTVGTGGNAQEPNVPAPDPGPDLVGGDGGAPSLESDAGQTSSEGGSSGIGPVPQAEPDGCVQFAAPTQVGEFDEDQLSQLSGMAASRAQPGVLYAHLDAGAAPVLFVSDLTGAALGTIVLQGAETIDWEDIAVSPSASDGTSWIYIGDIGDNAARSGGTPRTELSIFRLPEPAAPSNGAEVSVSDWERIVVRYPDDAHDAESLMYDPVADDLVILTKEDDGLSSVYRMPALAAAEEAVTLEWIAEVTIGQSGQGAQASAGDISFSGDRILVRNYENALLWPRTPGQSLADALAEAPLTLQTASEPQSEGITFSADGTSWFSAGEQVLSLYRADATCN